MKDLIDKLSVAFDTQLSTYAAFTEKLHALIIELLGAEGIRPHSVTCRTKQRASLLTKLSKEEGRYSQIEDITDISAIRIITYFADEVDHVAELIVREFEIDSDNSTDKRALLDPDRFGYLSLHYVVALSNERAKLTEYRKFAGRKAEVQVRSILQHAWAEVEHDLGYKTAPGVPRDVRRQFSRLAGLLEIADSEFIAIREALKHYERNVIQQIEQAPERVLVDKASLASFFASSTIMLNIDQKIASIADVKELMPISEGRLERHVSALQFVGISTIAQLESTLEQNADDIVAFARRLLHGTRLPMAGKGISLLYLEYMLIGREGDVDKAERFVQLMGFLPSAAAAREFAVEIVEGYRRKEI